MNGVDCHGVKRLRQIATFLGIASNDFGNSFNGSILPTRVLPLRRICQMKIYSGLHARTLFKHPSQFILSSTGIGGRLKSNKHTF